MKSGNPVKHQGQSLSCLAKLKVRRTRQTDAFMIRVMQKMGTEPFFESVCVFTRVTWPIRQLEIKV